MPIQRSDEGHLLRVVGKGRINPRLLASRRARADSSSIEVEPSARPKAEPAHGTGSTAPLIEALERGMGKG
jgi:hypothetical protein